MSDATPAGLSDWPPSCAAFCSASFFFLAAARAASLDGLPVPPNKRSGGRTCSDTIHPTLSSGTLNQGMPLKRSAGFVCGRGSGLVGTVPSPVRACSLVYRERMQQWRRPSPVSGKVVRLGCMCGGALCRRKGKGKVRKDGRTLDFYWLLSS